jgi:eukaryotic-like serine/threonine-protein kinase
VRFLLIDDDADYRKRLRYHVEVEWPDALVDEHQPRSTGRRPEEIPLEGVDAVLLGHPLAGEARLEWLALLAARAVHAGGPPILVFSDQSDEALEADARKAGAFGYFPKLQLRHGQLIAALRDATARETTAREAAPELVRPSFTPPPTRAPLAPSPAGARRHRFIAQLHATDLSTVYLAEDEDSGQQVVCKVVQHRSGAAGGRHFERFLLEYELIAAVRHPHVVRIFDLGIADDHAYIVMEHFPGGSLADRIARGSIGAERALEHARQIGAALDAIHAAGILHRDLKPANVMFRADGTLALIDFGLAKQLRLDASLTGTGQIFGTPHYMSPEQGHAEPTDERSDLYSLGCVLYEMLTAEKPFTAGTAMGVIYKHAHAPRPRLAPGHAHLQTLLDRLWAVRAEERFQSAGEWLRALRRHRS